MIRPFRDGDEEGMRDLFKACFGKEMSHEEWSWKYMDSYIGTSSVVGEDNGRIISHYGGLKLRFYWNGKTVDAYQGCDAMTHPEYQSRGIIVKTALGFYEANPEREFMFGFPSERHAQLSARWLGWEKYIFVSELTRKARRIRPLRYAWRIETGWDKITADEIDGLWEKTKDSGDLTLEKKSGYIFWRYRDKPGRGYEMVTFRGLIRRDLKAYAIVLEVGNELRVLDLIACGELKPERLMDCLERRAAKRGMKTIRIWSSPFIQVRNELIENGYREEKGIPLTLRIFEGSAFSPADFFNHYNYSLGDYDAA